jgi:hypothetical protein
MDEAQTPVPESVTLLIQAALERAMGWLAEDAQLLGFVVVESSSLPSMPLTRKGASGSTLGVALVLSQHVDTLRDFVRQNRDALDGYAVVMDATIRPSETTQSSDAVLVEAGARGGGSGLRVAIPYARAADGQLDLGSPGLVDRPANLLDVA